MSPQAMPTVRTYIRAADIEASVERAVELGATVALGPTEIVDEGRGMIVIDLNGGIEQGIWQVPKPAAR
ncbi:MAG: putative enzyme related to lactoylglutathione lyase [Planctomycetota bacterium]|jgi:predicted enzyme related to lactoylglutathione lyase